jgi:Glycosyl hydrolase family 30 beta sandwich domain
MQRVNTKNAATVKSVMTLAFVDPEDGSWAVVMINPEKHPANVRLWALPAEFPGQPRRRFYSTLTEPFTEEKTVPANNKVDLRPQSITTIYSGPLG